MTAPPENIPANKIGANVFSFTICTIIGNKYEAVDVSLVFWHSGGVSSSTGPLQIDGARPTLASTKDQVFQIRSHQILMTPSNSTKGRSELRGMVIAHCRLLRDSMSTKGIYTAVSGAMAQNARLETIANNIANANTPSFKRDAQLFREYLTSYEKGSDVLEVPKVPASIESFYNMQGGDSSYVENIGTFTDFTQGAIKQTGNPLDVAIEGNAFFEVLSPQGVRYTRAGNFSMDNEGRLVTKDGYPVLSAGVGAAATSRVIKLPSAEALSISRSGELLQKGQSLGKLSVVGFNNMDVLQKIGQNNYKLRENIPVTINPNPEVHLHQSSVETSNVNIVHEMTEMITATRTFESLQKAIQAYDQMNDKLVNQVPRL